MDIKQLLKQAVDAKIAGNQAGFNEAMKQVLAAKVSGMVSEMSNEDFGSDANGSGEPSPAEGDYWIHVGEYEYNGELVDLGVGVSIGHYQAATQGNYSPRAGDPSEYYGDDEEIEWHVVNANIIDEEGNETPLSGEEAANLTFNEQQHDKITSELQRQLQSEADDDDSWDNGADGTY